MKDNTGNFILDMMLQHAPYGIIIMDAGGMVDTSNTLARRFLNKVDKRVWEGGKSLLEVAPFDKFNLINKIRESQDKQEQFNFEFRFEYGRRELACGIYRLRDVIGISEKYICFLEDLSADSRFKDRNTRIRNIIYMLLNTVNDAVLVADYETRRITFANKAAVRMLGYEEHEIVNKPIAELHPEDDLERINYLLDRQARGEVSMVEDISFLKKNGDIVYVDINSILIEASGRKYILGVLRDITYKKALLSKLLTTNRLLEAIFEKTTLMFAHMNEDFRIVRVNENFAKILGPDVEQFVGRNFFDIFDKSKLKALFEEVVLLKKSLSMREFPFKTPDGRTVYVDFMVSSLEEEGSGLKGLIFSGIDVTELVSTRSALMEVEYIKNTLLHELNELVTYINTEFVIKWANKQYLSASVFDNFEDLVGEKCFMALENDDSPCETCPARQTLQDLKPHSSYVRFKDGKEFYVRSFPDIREDRLEGIVVACLDVTELRESERRIKRLNNMLTVMKEVNRTVMRGDSVEEIAREVTDILGKKEDSRFALIILTDKLNIPVFFSVSPENLRSSLRDLLSRMEKGDTPKCIERVFSEDMVIESKPVEECADCSLHDTCSEGYGLLAKRLEYRGHVMGILLVCLNNENIDDKEEVELFKELADDISYAIYHLKS